MNLGVNGVTNNMTVGGGVTMNVDGDLRLGADGVAQSRSSVAVLEGSNLSVLGLTEIGTRGQVGQSGELIFNAPDNADPSYLRGGATVGAASGSEGSLSIHTETWVTNGALR
ncbi:MAG: hypothetical protein ACYTGQ_18285, partial [Planctomycetota bacterium]